MSLTQHTQTAGILRDQVREAVIDFPAFDQRVKACQLERCRATCCHDGVYLSAEEKANVELLISDQPQAFADLETPVDQLFEVTAGGKVKTRAIPAANELLADDYPQHFPRTRCAFLDQLGRCTIQRYSMEHGFDAWFHKPLTCWLHPLLLKPGRRGNRPVLTLPSPDDDPQKAPGYPGFASCTHCGRPDPEGQPAKDALAPELERLSLISGRDLLGELNAEEVC